MSAVPRRGFGPALWTLCATQAVGAVGMSAGGAAGSLLGHDLSTSPFMAELPLGAVIVGATLTVPVVSGVMDRLGRRAGLLVGLLVAACGAAVVVAGAGIPSIALVLLGNALMGAGNTAVMLGRYAAADLVATHLRRRPELAVAAKAVSAAMTAVAVGAVLGPNLLGPAGGLAVGMGLPSSAGLYVLAVPAFLGAAALASLLPRTRATVAVTDDGRESPWGRVPLLVLVVLGSANAAMVTLMAFAPVQLHLHGWGLNAVGAMVSLHIAAMFAASPLSGALCARHDPRLVAFAGGALTVLSAGAIGLLPASSVFYAVALVVLGIGWNLQVVAGTTVLIITAPRRIRHHAEALGEITMGAPAVLATVAAGPMLAFAGTPGLTAAISLLGGGVALRLLLHRKRSIPEDSPEDTPELVSP